jgi:hypothetical protein
VKVISSCRPGGPLIHGPDAPRLNLLVHRAFYCGYKKRHGLKVQSVILPNGLDFNELVLRRSHLEADIPQVQQLRIYGDSGYEWLHHSHLRTRHHHDGPLSPQEIRENDAMKACREAVEWEFAGVTRLSIDLPRGKYPKKCFLLSEWITNSRIF